MTEVRRLASLPFDLAHDLPIRAALVKVATDDHFFLVVLHHVASDLWSFSVMTKELRALYEAFSAGKASPLRELGVQYADYALWQRDWLERGHLDAQLAYWKAALAGAPASLELPTDHPRPAVRASRGATVPFAIEKALLGAVEAFAQAEKATTFMVLLAAFSALLSRWSRQEDIVVGAPIAGRMRAELEPLMGMFVNTLALRTNLEGAPTFRELVNRVEEAALGAYSHQELPFARLVEALAPPRDTSRTPVFQVMFVFQNTPEVGPALGDLDAEARNLGSEVSTFDLTLWMFVGPGGLACTMEYDTALFERATVERLAAQLLLLLRGALANPAARVATLPLVDAEERRRVLVEWNATAQPMPDAHTAHALFEAQARRTPDATAVEFERHRVSYKELDARASRVARHLVGAGVKTGDRVAVEVERSGDMLAALLGVLKAGAAYVPIDPKLPEERRTFMKEDAATVMTLTDASLQAAIATADESPLPSVGADDVAYVLFTSGSTGRPKGVMVPHRALVNFLGAMKERPGLSASDVLVAITTLSFDIAGLELFLPLTVGATVVVASREVASDGEMLAKLLEERGATVLQATPATWRMLLAVGWRPTRRLRALCGGEALPPDLAEELARGCGELWNMYGPTETTIWSTCTRLETGSRITVGRPIGNTRVYVVDAAMQPAPIGVLGELCIGGAGVALGYVGRPELTSEKFVADPFSPVAGARMYRTGDLARWLPDGTLDFLGRIDHQVKIRGFRIELGEIEAVLVELGGVDNAVVIAHADAHGEKRLVAYVVDGPSSSDRAALRAALETKLPDYMIPTLFVALDALPLTSSGKVDRKALPAPDFAAAAAEYVAPRNRVEEAVAAAFQELLAIPRVGAHDDFFALGGHSLLAVRLLSQLRDRLGVSLPVRVVFQSPTVAQLAAQVELALGGAGGPRLERVAERSRAPLSLNQAIWWHRQQHWPSSPQPNFVMAYRLRGALDPEVLARSVDEEVRRHEALRTRFDVIDGEPWQRVVEPRAGVLERRDDSEGAKSVPKVLHDLHARTGYLGEAPVRFVLLRIAEEEHVLAIASHRAVFDPLVCDEVMAEIKAIYEALRAGGASPLAEPPLQYLDFVAWQQKLVATPEMQARVEGARAALAGASPLTLPYDVPEPATFTTGSHRILIPLDAAAWQAMDALSHSESTSPFVVELAIFTTFLAQLTHQHDVVVIAPNELARGLDSALSSVLGCFFDYFVLRTNLEGATTLRESVRRAHAEVQRAQRADVPCVLLTDDHAEGPLFRVALNSVTDGGAKVAAPSELAIELMPTPQHRMVDVAWAVIGRESLLVASTDKFSAETAARMAAAFTSFLRDYLTAPDRPFAEGPA
jgi:amino acid adenylation domain-containing protein